MSDGIEGLDKAAVTLGPGEGRAESSLRRLRVGGQPFFFLKQRGSFPDMAYDHGRLLAQEIETGAFPEIVSTIARSVNLESDLFSQVASALYRAYSDRVLAHSSDEFQAAVDGLAAGYRDARPNPKFSELEVRDALIAIEVGNVVDGVLHAFSIPGLRAAKAPGVLALVLSRLSDPEARSYLESAQQDTAKQKDVARVLQALGGPNNRVDFACTGFAVPAPLAARGLHLHARNLDADLYNWNKAPVLSLLDETGGNAAWHKYAAFGTAGLIYPGGISGLNDAGIAVSLHQMSTTEVESGFLFDSGDIAPFVQQRMLREAGSVDDAVAIAEDTRHFAAWTFFVSDAKSGKVRRIEVNGERVRVTRHEGEAVAQTNHFLHHDMMERVFDGEDNHFTPTFGKWLETHARFDSVSAALKADAGQQRIDVGWAIDWLASSRDGSLEKIRRQLPHPPDPLAAERAFGRVPRKVYGQLGSIVLADPQRRPWRDQVWMTTGDRQPSPHSSYVGWQVDWEGFELNPLADPTLRRVEHYEKQGRRNWEVSLERYLWARLARSRPRDAAGELLRRRPTAAEDRDGVNGAIHLLGSAIDLAALDRLVEVPYHYMRARFNHDAGDYAAAEKDWRLLRAIWAWQNDAPAIPADWPVSVPRVMPLMNAYDGALVALLSTATEDLLQGNTAWDGRGERLDQARSLFAQVKQECFGDKPPHFDLAAWIDLVDEVDTKGGGRVELPEPNFITAE
ncbi:C45 family autoproteolytic acyltransferase/hydolase [Pelagibius marinus]|uniref:C45 family autoproteolytic acyltransferase/hydolase n=1 Tax=Pelagibius marinus TaxID=2762760 RepID=UPI001872BC02|nr:C45 family autoproteolytic acyltransferase/hydolase [Pelagibius marinus]